LIGEPHQVKGRRRWPARLTIREVEVLRPLARGQLRQLEPVPARVLVADDDVVAIEHAAAM